MADILYFGINNWYTLQQRSQHLASALSQWHRVFYINSCYYSLYGYIRDQLQLAHPPRHNIHHITQLDDQLYLIDLFPLLPKGLIYPQIAAFNYNILLRLLRQILRSYDVGTDCVLWLSLPPDNFILNYMESKLSVYDCMDNHAQFHKEPVQKRLTELEDKLLKRVGLVFASSDGLYKYCKAQNEHTYLVRNGVASYFFEDEYSTPLPDYIQQPRIGYIGTIGPWVDIELLYKIALRFTNAQLILIGPVETEILHLQQLPNVHVLEPRPHQEMPAYINSFDVCLIPFRQSALTIDVNPVKLYEYMALGKPIVSTKLPEVVLYTPLVQTASTHSQFLTEIKFALTKQGTETDSAKRQDLASQNTWQYRAEIIHELLQKYL